MSWHHIVCAGPPSTFDGLVYDLPAKAHSSLEMGPPSVGRASRVPSSRVAVRMRTSTNHESWEVSTRVEVGSVASPGS